MRISDWSSDVCSSVFAQALVEQPPVLARDGGVFADDHDAELAELRRLSTSADQFLVDLEQRERAASGIPTLQVGYNRVHGYYLELSTAHVAKAPTHYTRLQTPPRPERSIPDTPQASRHPALDPPEPSLAPPRLPPEPLLHP